MLKNIFNFYFNLLSFMKHASNKLTLKPANQDDKIVDYSLKRKKVSINDNTITRFLQIQSKLELYEQNGVFEDLR